MTQTITREVSLEVLMEARTWTPAILSEILKTMSRDFKQEQFNDLASNAQQLGHKGVKITIEIKSWPLALGLAETIPS